MKLRRAASLLPLAVASVVAVASLAGCSGTKKDGGTATGTKGAYSTQTKGAPAGPAYGKAVPDKDFCGIFSAKDFDSLHLAYRDPTAGDFAAAAKPIGVSCTFAGSDGIDVGVLPSEAEATAFVAARRATGKQVADKPVAAAADSFFASSSATPGGYELLARRGTLVVLVNLDPAVNPLTPDAARSAAVALTGMVLDRAPKLGS
jgi:hypothetical protein